MLHDHTLIKVKAALRRFERMDKAMNRIIAKFDKLGHGARADEVSERLNRQADKIYREWQRELVDAPSELWVALRARGLIEPVYTGSRKRRGQSDV